MALSGGQRGSLSLYGGIGSRRGSFAGKSLSNPPLVILSARAFLSPVAAAVPSLKSPVSARPVLKPER